MSKYNTRNLILIGTLLSLFLFSAYRSTNSALLITFLYITGMRKCNIDDTVKTMYNVYKFFIPVCAAASIIMSLLGKTKLSMVIGGRIRYTFGFIHPNSLGAIILSLVLMYCWINYDKMNPKMYSKIIIIETITYILTKSRTSYLCFIVFILGVWITKKNNINFNKAIDSLAHVLFPCLAILTYSLAKLYKSSNHFILLIDSALTGRIRLAAYALQRSGVTWLGRKIDYFGNIGYQSSWDMSVFTFDNLYSLLLINVGIVYVLVLSIAIYVATKKLHTRENVFVVIWIIYGFTEVSALNGYAMFPIFLLTAIFQSGFSCETTKKRQIKKLYKIPAINYNFNRL